MIIVGKCSRLLVGKKSAIVALFVPSNTARPLPPKSIMNTRPHLRLSRYSSERAATEIDRMRYGTPLEPYRSGWPKLAYGIENTVAVAGIMAAM